MENTLPEKNLKRMTIVMPEGGVLKAHTVSDCVFVDLSGIEIPIEGKKESIGQMGIFLILTLVIAVGYSILTAL